MVSEEFVNFIPEDDRLANSRDANPLETIWILVTQHTKIPSGRGKTATTLRLEKCEFRHALVEMALNRQNRQTVNKNSNEMAKGPFGKW